MKINSKQATNNLTHVLHFLNDNLHSCLLKINHVTTFRLLSDYFQIAFRLLSDYFHDTCKRHVERKYSKSKGLKQMNYHVMQDFKCVLGYFLWVI